MAWSRRRLALLFIALAVPVLANRATEPAGMAPEKRLFGLFDPLSVRACSRRWSSTGGSRMTHTRTKSCAPGSATRARLMALLLGAFVILMFADHHRQDRRSTSDQPRRTATRRTGLIDGAARGGDGRPRLRLGAALPLVLRSDRFRRDAAARTGDAPGAVARPRSACGSTPISTRPCRGGSSRSQATGPDRARRADDQSLTARPI